MVSQVVLDAVRKAIIDGIQRNGDRIHSYSMDTAGCFVPRDTGFLAASGGTDPIPNKGVDVYFRADYSAVVEFGQDESPITGTQRVYIPTHTIKKGKRKGTIVNGHYKEYKNARLVTWRPKISKFERGEKISRIITKEPKLEGQFFLTRAALKGIQELPEDLEFYLRQLENKRFS